MNKIDSFQGEYRWLSNFWLVTVKYDGQYYDSVEHAYVAAKTTDPVIRRMIALTEKPGKVKRFGKTMHVRPDWESIKVEVMHDLLRQKFRYTRLKGLLLATGFVELIEGNTWGDTFWGVCNGEGQNMLGKLLMDVRAELRIEVFDAND